MLGSSSKRITFQTYAHDARTSAEPAIRFRYPEDRPEHRPRVPQPGPKMAWEPENGGAASASSSRVDRVSKSTAQPSANPWVPLAKFEKAPMNSTWETITTTAVSKAETQISIPSPPMTVSETNPFRRKAAKAAAGSSATSANAASSLEPSARWASLQKTAAGLHDATCAFDCATSRATSQLATATSSTAAKSNAVDLGDWELYDAAVWEAASDGSPLDYALRGDTGATATAPEEAVKECVVCAEEKPPHEFPQYAITDGCTHLPGTCAQCLQTHIHTELASKIWHDKVVTCPQCREALAYQDVQNHADVETFQRFASLLTNQTVSALPDFFWCPDAACGSGQIHVHIPPSEGGAEHDVVTCAACQKQWCYRHRVAWHETLSCDEYDAFLASPETFRSNYDRAVAEAESEAAALRLLRREQEEKDAELARSLLEEEQREAAAARAEAERAARAKQERLERERLEAERRAAEERRQREADEVRRRQRDEQANLHTLSRTTKQCPNCMWSIEKVDGCNRITCSRCQYQFWWCCMAKFVTYERGVFGGHAASCSGLVWPQE